MQRLSLDMFISDGSDIELKQYKVLQALRQYHDEFSHNRVYPTLSELIELHNSLDSLLQQKNDLESKLPHELQDIDIEHGRLVFGSSGDERSDLSRTIELIVWTLPYITKAIDEGMAIFNFVDEHVAIDEVGIMPMYRGEGYWFVPNTKASQLNLLRYEVSLFTSASERFRTLKTRLLEAVHQEHIHRSPESLKLELIEKYRDLPNPATYVCRTDLDFPYVETLLPIAKRKLMSHLFS